MVRSSEIWYFDLKDKVVSLIPSPLRQIISISTSSCPLVYVYCKFKFEFILMISLIQFSKLHIIHYTLGPLKPWDWYTTWLVKLVDAWQSITVRLDETLPGTGRGKTPNDELIVKLLFFLPFCGLLFCRYRSIQVRGDFLLYQNRRSLSEFLPKISGSFMEEISKSLERDDEARSVNTSSAVCQKIYVKGSIIDNVDPYTSQKHQEVMPMAGIDAMKRANSTLEDFKPIVRPHQLPYPLLPLLRFM